MKNETKALDIWKYKVAYQYGGMLEDLEDRPWRYSIPGLGIFETRGSTDDLKLLAKQCVTIWEDYNDVSCTELPRRTKSMHISINPDPVEGGAFTYFNQPLSNDDIKELYKHVKKIVSKTLHDGSLNTLLDKLDASIDKSHKDVEVLRRIRD